MEKLIRVEHINKYFGSFKAIDDISFELDGGKILLLLIEAIRRKPLSEKFEITVQLIGFSLLILLSIYVSYNDILRLF